MKLFLAISLCVVVFFVCVGITIKVICDMRFYRDIIIETNKLVREYEEHWDRVIKLAEEIIKYNEDLADRNQRLIYENEKLLETLTDKEEE